MTGFGGACTSGEGRQTPYSGKILNSKTKDSSSNGKDNTNHENNREVVSKPRKATYARARTDRYAHTQPRTHARTSCTCLDKHRHTHSDNDDHDHRIEPTRQHQRQLEPNGQYPQQHTVIKKYDNDSTTHTTTKQQHHQQKCHLGVIVDRQNNTRNRSCTAILKGSGLFNRGHQGRRHECGRAPLLRYLRRVLHPGAPDFVRSVTAP
jgi:hypothetical protein